MKRVKAYTSSLWPLAGLLILIQIVFVASYIGHERTIYYWDHGMYIAMAQQFQSIAAQDIGFGWQMFHQSLAQNYNLIFALPDLISFSLFGASRLVFILTNFIVFFLSYEIAVAFLLRRALGWRWDLALAVSFAAACFTPPLWLPLLEGYPDSGAAACIVLAAAIGCKGAVQPRLIRRGLALGAVLALAILLRRHFAYPAFAMLGTLGILEAVRIWRVRNSYQQIKLAAIYFLFCAFGLAGVLLLIAPDFVRSALTVNYGALYISYKREALVFLRFTLGGFGIGLLLIAASGLGLLALRRAAGRKLAWLTGLYLLLWLVIWCSGPDQMGHHYMLHALPLFVAIGLAGWFVFISGLAAKRKYICGGLLLVFLSANAFWALWLSPGGAAPNDNGRPGLLSAARPPVIRGDYDELHRLALYLQHNVKPTDRIMVVGSSFVFNLDLLNHVFMDLPGAGNMIGLFAKNPEIDHEEPAPLDVFASSNIYLVPEPAQYHLDPAGQRVITAAANQFPPPASRAMLFHTDKEVFHLNDGVNLRIWRRDNWLPGKLHEALGEIRRDGPNDANFNQLWAADIQPLRTQIFTDARGVTMAGALFDTDHADMRLFFDYPLEKGPQRLVFEYGTNCPKPHFHFEVVSASGKNEIAKDIALLAPGQASAGYNLSDSREARFLRLEISTSPLSLCQMQLQNLRIEKTP